MEWLTGIFSWIMSAFFGTENSDGVREGGLIQNVWDGAKSVGSGVMDWFADDEVSLGVKAAAALGGAYLLFPETTSKVVGKAVDGVTSTIGGVAGSVATAATSFLSRWWPLMALGLGVYWVFFSDDDDSGDD